jgi:hypothetical protein
VPVRRYMQSSDHHLQDQARWLTGSTSEICNKTSRNKWSTFRMSRN